MTCIQTIIYLTCAALQALPGTGHPPCESGGMVLAVVRANIPTDPEAPTSLPVDPGFEVLSERKPSTGCTETPTVLPAAEHYPWCVVGHVQRAEVDHGEELVTPALPPYHGVCCREGCSCVSAQCETIPIGGPLGYASERARRHAPEVKP